MVPVKNEIRPPSKRWRSRRSLNNQIKMMLIAAPIPTVSHMTPGMLAVTP
jgi:hypothetical protein